MGFLDPVSLTAATTIGGSVIDAVASLWGGESAKKALDKQLKAQAQQLKAQAQMQQQAMSAVAQQQALLEKQRADELAYQAAMKQRSQQLMALYAVGGVAVVVAGFFIVSAMRKKRG